MRLYQKIAEANAHNVSINLPQVIIHPSIYNPSKTKKLRILFSNHKQTLQLQFLSLKKRQLYIVYFYFCLFDFPLLFNISTIVSFKIITTIIDSFRNQYKFSKR